MLNCNQKGGIRCGLLMVITLVECITSAKMLWRLMFIQRTFAHITYILKG